MSAILFHTTSKEKLPHLSLILLKPEPLGAEFKTVACSITGHLILLEIQHRKEGMKLRQYHLELGATAACNKKLM